jgi:uncharacterized protein (TIRG00374 family)
MKSLKIYLKGYFYRTITPGHLGAWIRVHYLKEETKEPYGKSFVNYLIYAMMGYLPIFLFILIGTFYLINQLPQAFILTVIFLAILLSVIFLFSKKDRGGKILNVLVKWLIPQKAKHVFKSFIGTFYQDFPKLKGLIYPFLIGFFNLVLLNSQLYLIALILDANIPYFTFLMLYPLIGAITLIPISPGSIGTREAAVIFLFSFYGIDPAVSVVISLTGFMIHSVPLCITGFFISLGDIKIDSKRSIFQKISIKKVFMINFKR